MLRPVWAYFARLRQQTLSSWRARRFGAVHEPVEGRTQHYTENPALGK